MFLDTAICIHLCPFLASAIPQQYSEPKGVSNFCSRHVECCISQPLIRKTKLLGDLYWRVFNLASGLACNLAVKILIWTT